MNYIAMYIDFLKKEFSLVKPLKIIADCSNGPAGMVLKELTHIKNLEIILINDTPDPDFKAHGPNPLVPGATKDAEEAVLKHKADLAVIFDADADRAFFVDNEGVTLPSFLTASLLFRSNPAPYVADELVYKSLEHTGIIDITQVVPSKVGTRYVKEKMKEHTASVAAELSGHYYFKKFFNTDSGIFATIQVLNILSKLPQSLAEYRKSLPKHELINEEIKLGTKTWVEIEPKIIQFATENKIKMETREGITLDTGDSWVNMRTSNTEPILRLIGGSKDLALMKDLLSKLRALV
jgi:phosphomannomutase